MSKSKHNKTEIYFQVALLPMPQLTESSGSIAAAGNVSCGPNKPTAISYPNYKKNNGQTTYGVNTNINGGNAISNANNNNGTLMHNYTGLLAFILYFEIYLILIFFLGRVYPKITVLQIITHHSEIGVLVFNFRNESTGLGW